MTGRSRLWLASAASAIFFDAGATSGSAAEIVEARSADFAMPGYLDALDDGRVYKEGAFNANFMGYATDGKALSRSATSSAEDDAFENLSSLAVAFPHLDCDSDGVSGAKIVDFGIWRDRREVMGFHGKLILKGIEWRFAHVCNFPSVYSWGRQCKRIARYSRSVLMRRTPFPAGGSVAVFTRARFSGMLEIEGVLTL